ncbi:MAG: hypothetical protein BWY65_02185 [Firmicutes bacterium ADurb.Bin373]|nr:MAG: hypothetical protein BWY65_02185 [Firmicutes bacterium ADurb.Bin373]
MRFNKGYILFAGGHQPHDEIRVEAGFFKETDAFPADVADNIQLFISKEGFFPTHIKPQGLDKVNLAFIKGHWGDGDIDIVFSQVHDRIIH